MQSRNPAIISLLREVLGLAITCSALVYYWGYRATQVPLIAAFGSRLPFTGHEYWNAGLEYLVSVGAPFLGGAVFGLILVAVDPDPERTRWGRRGIVASVLIGLVLYAAFWFRPIPVLVAPLLLCAGFVGGYVGSLVISTYMFMIDKEHIVSLLHATIERQEQTFTDRLNAPDFLGLRSDDPGDRLIASQRNTVFAAHRQWIDSKRVELEQAQDRRRQARLAAASAAVAALFIVASGLFLSLQCVELVSLEKGLEGRYPMLTLVSDKQISDLGVVTPQGDEFAYSVRLVLRSGDQIFLLTPDRKKAVILAARPGIRFIMDR